MESENLEVKGQQSSSLNKVTPLSKYLAMILFIVMPFIGGWVGYMYAPEKVVEIEKTIEVERSSPHSESKTIENISAPLGMSELVTTDNIATRVTIDTLPLNSGMQGSYPDLKKYSFQNGFYSVSFDLSRYATFHDDYSDPSIDDIGKGTYQGIFTEITYNEDVTPPTSTEKTLFAIKVFSKDYCKLSLCEYKTKSKVTFNGNEWEFIGPTQYCDVGHCGGYNYVYRRSLGAYMVYLQSEEDLTNENLSVNIRQVIDSLSINLINR